MTFLGIVEDLFGRRPDRQIEGTLVKAKPTSSLSFCRTLDCLDFTQPLGEIGDAKEGDNSAV